MLIEMVTYFLDTIFLQRSQYLLCDEWVLFRLHLRLVSDSSQNRLYVGKHWGDF